MLEFSKEMNHQFKKYFYFIMKILGNAKSEFIKKVKRELGDDFELEL